MDGPIPPPPNGLHYNWYRSYDLGRYTQPDPHGFVDGPSVYGYAGGSPEVYVDNDGRIIPFLIPLIIGGAALGVGGDIAIQTAENYYTNGGDFSRALLCVNISSLPYSALAGAAGAGTINILRRIIISRIPINSFELRLYGKAFILSKIGVLLSPPITIQDILHPSAGNDPSNPCSCSFVRRK
jgi:hypothetical protein